MSIFGSLQQQINALPAPAAPAAARRGLFGRPGPDLGRALTFLTQGTGGLDRQRAISAQETQARMAEQQRAQREAYAATIQDPRERQIFLTAPDEWAKNNAQQFAPQVVGAGAAQVVNGRRTVEQPTYAESGDQTLRRDSVGVAPAYTRTEPSIAERIQQQNADSQRITATRPQIANLSVGEQAFGVGPQGQVQPLAQNTAPRPMSAVDRRQMLEDQEVVQGLGTVNERLGTVAQQIATGQLNLGPMTNMLSQGRNMVGASDQNSRNYASFKSTLESLRNESLRLNSGVQTEGDAQRAWNELLANVNDEKLVAQRLQEIMALNQRALAFREARLQDFGGQGQPQAAPQGQGGPRPRARNPQTGQVVEFNGSQWVPVS